MEVNIAKSKIVCFKSGGHNLPLCSIFKYGELKLDAVNEYTYLGVTFSSSSLFRKNTSVAVKKSKTATGSVMTLLTNSKTDNWSVRTTLFNTIIVNSLAYCAGVWSLRYCKELEIVQTAFFKRLLGLPRNTPDYIVRLETGTVKLAYICFKLAISLYIRILALPSQRFPNQCLVRLINLDKSGWRDERHNWVSQVHNIFDRVGMSDLWTPLNLQLLRHNKQRILDTYYNYLHNIDRERATNSSYSLYYQSFLQTTDPARHLTLRTSIQVIRVISQLRVCSRKSIQIYLPKLQRHNIDCTLNCTICNLNELESVEHIFLRCPIYQPFRCELIRSLHSVDDIALLLDSLTPPTCKSLYVYITSCLKMRAFILEE